MNRIKLSALLAVICAVSFVSAQEPGYNDNGSSETEKTDVLQATVLDKDGGKGMPMVESRGVWMVWQDYASQNRESTLKKLDHFKEIGLNTVYVCTNMRGYVVYPNSKLLPQFPDIQTSQPDVLKWLIPAIKDRGLRVEAWPEYGFYAYWVPKSSEDKTLGPMLTKHPELVAVDKDGKNAHVDEKLGSFYAACAANPKTHEFIISEYMELFERYPGFDGLNLDRIRWTNDKFCYCDYCKTEFKKRYGYDLVPGFNDGSKQAKDRDEFRKEGTGEFVRKMREAMKSKYPKKTLSSAVVAPEMIDEKGQDWFSWVEKGYVDAVMPMIYRPSIAKELNMMRERLGNDAPVFAGLGNAIGQDKFCRQVMELRALGLPGFTIWASNDLSLIDGNLKAKLFWRPAESPFQLKQQPKAAQK